MPLCTRGKKPDEYQSQNVPFFFKQWGVINKKKNWRFLDGLIWNAMPAKYLTLK
jgi:protein gp37